MFTQHVVTCEDAHALGLSDVVHENCTVIFGRDDDRDWVAWTSHAPNVPPEDGSESMFPTDWQERVNPDLETTDWVSPKTPDPTKEMRVYDFTVLDEVRE